MVTYEYYQNVYGGDQIPAESFYPIENKSARYVHKLTHYRLTGIDIPENAKMAACAVCDTLYELQGVANITGVKSENNDGYSISYADNLKSQMLSAVKDAVSAYLPPSDPLRYAGVK